jgi:hypothetical protein
MKSGAGEPLVEILGAEVTERGYRIVARFSDPYLEPVAPGAFYDKQGSGEEVFPVHRVSKRDGLTLTFETFDSGRKLPPVGRALFYRGWWVRAAMDAALDVRCEWKRLAYPDNGSHDHCLFTWETISASTGERLGYFSEKYGWITEKAYMDFIVRDVFRLRNRP